ncbi:MAG: PT domain-containing protein, partial [Chloroflexi bacterium]|nr:PT domain-containing protein [Chloroflexota bacterium]
MGLRQRICSMLLAILLLAGCSVGRAAAPVPEPTAVPTLVPTIAPSATPTAAPSLTPTAAPTRTPLPETLLWFDPALESALAEPLCTAAQSIGAGCTDSRDEATLVVAPSAGTPLAVWYYAPVVPFPTINDDIAMDEFEAFWAGDTGALSILTGDGTSPTLYVSPETLAGLSALFGVPDEKTPIQVAAAESLVNLAWNARPHAWAVVPFDALEPRWKVLRLDGLSLLDKELDPEAWPLTLHIGVEGAQAEELRDVAASAHVALTNRDTGEMTVLMMTGVTAMVRSIAYRMETKGILYPGLEISGTLASADITHIS